MGWLEDPEERKRVLMDLHVMSIHCCPHIVRYYGSVIWNVRKLWQHLSARAFHVLCVLCMCVCLSYSSKICTHMYVYNVHVHVCVCVSVPLLSVCLCLHACVCVYMSLCLCMCFFMLSESNILLNLTI